MHIGNHPERSNIELSIQECGGVRNETAEDRILPVSVQMFLRFVALVEEPQGGICYRAVQVIDHSGVGTGRRNEPFNPTRKIFFLSSYAAQEYGVNNGLCHVRFPQE
jgi:hypothetical protein